MQRLDESELKLYLKQLQKQFAKGSKGDAANDQVILEAKCGNELLNATASKVLLETTFGVTQVIYLNCTGDVL